VNDIIIPAAFYDIARNNDVWCPIEQEIRTKGRGRQYVIDRNDEGLPYLIQHADESLAKAPKIAAAARNLLLSLRKQHVAFKLVINEDALRVSTAKPVTRRTAAKATGRDYNRELIVTITPRGDLILRPVGRRQSEQVALSDVYAWVQRSRCLKIARDKAAIKASKKKSRR
jgi:hypothetical protein